VLQRLDAVPAGSILALAEHADRPDLTAILLDDPARSRERTAWRSVYSRFHRGGPEAVAAEADACRVTAAELHNACYTVHVYDISTQTAEEVAALVADSVLARLDGNRTTEPS
jgi:dTMP kinase